MVNCERCAQLEIMLKQVIMLAAQYVEEYGPTHSIDGDILEAASALYAGKAKEKPRCQEH